jgi:hypothetical protein
LNCRYFRRELVGKQGIDKKAMPKLFGAWIDKSLATCIFTKAQKRSFKTGELQACPWYLEIACKFVLGGEMDEQAAVTSNTPVPEDISLYESEPKIAVEVVSVVLLKEKKPRNKKAKKAKNAKKRDVVVDLGDNAVARDGG